MSHAAATAWARIPGSHPPHDVEPVGDAVRHTASPRRLYRLRRAGAGGSNVIAKHGPPEPLRLERMIYQEILPDLGLSTIRCLGLCESEAGGWLFLEEAVGRPYEPDRAADRALAARWLGSLHAATTTTDLAARIPARHLDDYRRKLVDARHALRAGLEHPALDPAGADTLRRTDARLADLEARWTDLERRWAPLPRCLVHGDFIRKNIVVRDAGRGPELAVLDWEHSGWGVPAEDVAGLDVDAYAAAWHEHGARLSEDDARTLSDVGAVVQAVAWIESWSIGLMGAWIDRTLAALGRSADDLERACARAGVGS